MEVARYDSIIYEAKLSYGSNTESNQLTLSAVEAARALGISARMLFTLTKNGEVPHVRLGRRILYPAHELREWIGRKVSNGSATKSSSAI